MNFTSPQYFRERNPHRDMFRVNQKYHARIIAMFMAISVPCIMAPRSDAEILNVAQLNWGSLDFSTIVDSNGSPLPAENFVFDLGAFRSDFTPNESNVADWAANWVTFDRASYVIDEFGTAVFASSYSFYDDIFSSGVDETGSNFETLGISREAYIWVYNSTEPEPGTEWFVGRSSTWQFPQVTGECCNHDEPMQWSMGDLVSSDIPLWGNQLGYEGSGERSVFNGGADLQTYTFIPEPSSALLVAMAGIMGALRRSRQPKAI